MEDSVADGLGKVLEGSKEDSWLTQQLKLTRDQLDKKSRLCEQLAKELRKLEAGTREARATPRATNGERRVSGAIRLESLEVDEETPLSPTLRAPVTTEARFAPLSMQTFGTPADDLLDEDDLPAIVAKFERCAAQVTNATSGAKLRTAEGALLAMADKIREVCGRAVEGNRDILQEVFGGPCEELNRMYHVLDTVELSEAHQDDQRWDACRKQLDGLREALASHAAANNGKAPCISKPKEAVSLEKGGCGNDGKATATPTDVPADVQALQAELARERQLRSEAERILESMNAKRKEELRELKQELRHLSTGIEEKEEEILSIQFDMVELQNRLKDQAQLVASNAEAFQQASEELADKDEMLEQALQKQEELLGQINSVSEQLQTKIHKLSKELDNSRDDYKALESQMRAVVSHLETERDALRLELQRARAEGDAQLAILRAELQRREAAAGAKRASLEEELERALAAAEAQAARAKRQLEAQMRSQGAVLAAATGPEAAGSPLTSPKQPSATPLASEWSRHVVGSQEERNLLTEERLAWAEGQIADLSAALDRSRLLEQQALERAEEYRASLALGGEGSPQALRGGFSRVSSGGAGSTDDLEARGGGGWGGVQAAALPSVLIEVELDLGQVAGVACLRVAPWQTRSDFQTVVREFLLENRVKAVFTEALVKYLEEVEAQANTFPCFVKANLSDIYSVYG